LAGLIDCRISLKAWYKGEVYKAALLKNGTISYEKEKFISPSAAANVITRRSVYGRSFWRYKDKEGEWVKMKGLRG